MRNLVKEYWRWGWSRGRLWAGAATMFEMRGWGGVGGVKPPITAQDPGICAFQGDPGWVP